MALYDDYFTNEDKPFAENLNDALLLSNVFDMTVPIQIPQMFSNSTWVSTTSPRKCGVAVLTLKDGLPTGISVGTDSGTGNSTLTGTGTVKLSFYPNFNSFGKFKSMTWENTGTIVVNLKTATGTTIASNISKGNIDNQSSELRTLQEIVIEIVFTNATLKSFEVVMENKQQTRYGAEVGISDVTGLNNQLDSKVDKRVKITASSTNLVDLNDYTTAGFYYTNSNSECAYISHLAENDKAFFLLVEDWGTSNYTKQTITHYGTGKTYTRIRNAGNWGSWKQLLDYSNLENTSSNIKMNGTASVGSLGTVARADHIHPSDTSKVNVSSIVDNLTSTSTTAPLSAKQGKALNDTKINISSIVDNLTSTDTNKPLSAKQGKVLNDTKLSTSNLFNLVYPVGSIYMSVNSTSPATLFGGTWEKIKDTFLLASGDNYNNGATGGSADATLVSHNHGANVSGEYFVTSEIETANNTTVSYNSNGNRIVDGQLSGGSSFHHRVGTGYVGSSGTGKNMPPYLAVNVWKRTA